MYVCMLFINFSSHCWFVIVKLRTKLNIDSLSSAFVHILFHIHILIKDFYYCYEGILLLNCTTV